MLKLLLTRGAEVDARDTVGQTPLQVASQTLSAGTIVLLLLANRAEVNTRDNEGRTPVDLTSMKGYDDTVKILVGNGAGGGK